MKIVVVVEIVLIANFLAICLLVIFFDFGTNVVAEFVVQIQIHGKDWGSLVSLSSRLYDKGSAGARVSDQQQISEKGLDPFRLCHLNDLNLTGKKPKKELKK